MGSGDQVSSIDPNNNQRSSKFGNLANQIPIFKISPPGSEQNSDSDDQSPPDSPPPLQIKRIGHLRDDNELYRSRSEASLVQKPKKGCLLNKNSNLKHKLPRHVSFADASGFALTQICIIDDQSKYLPDFMDIDDTKIDICLLATRKTSAPGKICPQIRNQRRFVPYFTLPWTEPGKQKLLQETLEDRKICLESVSVNSPWHITGTILVKNLSFQKRVFVRQSLDKWQTYKDIQAEYISAVNPEVDRFKFDLGFPFKMGAGTRLELALGCEQGDTSAQYWDNNCGNNYAFWYNDKV